MTDAEESIMWRLIFGLFKASIYTLIGLIWTAFVAAASSLTFLFTYVVVLFFSYIFGKLAHIVNSILGAVLI